MSGEYSRKGECNNCGWCCQFIEVIRTTIPVKLVTDDIEKFYKLRNGVKCPDGKIRFTSHAFIPCTKHNNNPPNVGCTCYDERPEVCRIYPTLPSQIEGTPCSYWFERVTEKGIEYRGGLDSEHPSPPRFGD